MPRIPELAWIDTETSGLDPQNDRILEIAVIITDYNLNELERYEQKIKLSPIDLLAASPEALKVNGYSEAEWGDAPLPCKEIWQKIYDLTAYRLLAGQNVTNFDSKFVAAEMLRFGITPRWDRRMADTMADSIRLMYALGIVDDRKGFYTANLGHVYRRLGGPPMPEHRAMADVERALFVYRKFNNAMLDALAAGKILEPKKASVIAENVDANGTPVH